MPHDSSESLLAAASDPVHPNERTGAVLDDRRSSTAIRPEREQTIGPELRAEDVPTTPKPAIASTAELLGSASHSLASPALPRPRSFPIRPRELVPGAAPRRARATSQGRWIGRALITTAKLGLLTFIAYGLMFNFSVVRGSSMSPGIHDGDRILVNHLSYVFQDVQRGDIVVLQYPLDPNLDYIKRVIGLPGDEVCVDGDGVYVNGKRLDEPYVASQDSHSHLVTRVAPDHFFVMGDNRPHSSDSREFGQVPRENLRGKVDVRVWPPSRLGTLQ